MANGPDFSDLESAFNIPAGSTDLSNKKNIRQTETAIVRQTNELQRSVNELQEIDLIDDVDKSLEEQVARGKEYLRRKAIMMYESVEECVIMLKSELMPGAPASMWLAYSNLVRAANECHGKIEGIYNKLQDELQFTLPEGMADDDQSDGVTTDVDTLMELIEASVNKKKKIDVSDVLDVTPDVEIEDE